MEMYRGGLIRLIREFKRIEYGDVSVSLSWRRQDLNDLYKERAIKREMKQETGQKSH